MGSNFHCTVDNMYDNLLISSIDKAAFKYCMLFYISDYYFSSFFRLKFIRILSTGEGLLNVQDGATEDGLRNVFCTNIFGHYVLVR